MNYKNACLLFDQMVSIAKKELVNFTLTHPFKEEKKADKSLVTACDKRIDRLLSQLAKGAGFQVVSEEGEHAIDIVRSGSYITIDPIDGTNRYIENVRFALEQGGIQHFLKTDMGPNYDFGMLAGIVEKGIPQYGLVYSYATREKIFIDGNNKNNLIRENNIRNYKGKYVVYTHHSQQSAIDTLLAKLPDVRIISQSAFGIKSTYAIINPHDSSVALQRKSDLGLWDIMPAAVAARAFGATIYDGKGNPLLLTEYVMLPSVGATVIKGEKFQFVLSEIKNSK